jgi:hypothetical protein
MTIDAFKTMKANQKGNTRGLFIVKSPVSKLTSLKLPGSKLSRN